MPFVLMDVLCAVRTDGCSLRLFVLMDILCAVRTDGCSLCRSY